MICDVERGQFVRRLSGRAGETLAHVVEEVDAAHEFHRKEPTRAVGHQLEEGDEIWMRDICEGAKLTFETIEIIGGGAHERLERDDALALAVVSFVNDAHAARVNHLLSAGMMCQGAQRVLVCRKASSKTSM